MRPVVISRFPTAASGFAGTKEGRWNLKLEEDGRPSIPCSVSPTSPMLANRLLSGVRGCRRRNQKGLVPFKTVDHRRGRTAGGHGLRSDDRPAGGGVAPTGAVDNDPQTIQPTTTDPKPYTPAWQEAITGVPAADAIRVAREFADNAERTRGKSMIFLGAGTNHWYHSDMIYRTIILTTLCGCQGVNGGGWAHYVGQEKVRPQAAWSQVAFGWTGNGRRGCKTAPRFTILPATSGATTRCGPRASFRRWPKKSPCSTWPITT
jgi:nitrate reductase alpha subunit